MIDIRSEHIKELISIVRKVGLNRCSFEYYMNGETKPLESKENCDVEKVPALIEEIKRKHGLACNIKDTKETSPIEVKRAYDQCAHWVQDPKKHGYRTSCTIYDIFVGAEAGDSFGKEIPAMIAHNSSSGDFIFMLPHKVTGVEFSLNRFALMMKGKLDSREVCSHPEATISICDFLRDLKQDLDSHT